MRFYTKQHKFYCGIDLHTTKMYLCILDQEGVIRLHRNIRTQPELFLHAVEPYRENLVICVECMFSWYWLADLCREKKISFVLGHALYMGAIHGGKSKNDKIDSRKIALLLRGGMIPMAYVYPKEMRAARDLLRRRNHLMRKRAELLTHIQNTAKQYNLPDPLGSISKSRNRVGLLAKFKEPAFRLSIWANLEMIEAHDFVLEELERAIVKEARHHDPTSYALLKTIPGVGKILALDLLYEIGDIRRFPKVQNFSSYSRLVRCAKESNGKRYGTSGKKMGNAHLRWAFGQATQLFYMRNKRGKKLMNRLTVRYGKGKALSVLAHKLGRAVYYILTNRRGFDMDKYLTC